MVGVGFFGGVEEDQGEQWAKNTLFHHCCLEYFLDPPPPPCGVSCQCLRQRDTDRRLGQCDHG